VWFDAECGHRCISDGLAGEVVAILEDCLHREATSCRSATDVCQQDFPSAEGHAGPVVADMAEESAFDGFHFEQPVA